MLSSCPLSNSHSNHLLSSCLFFSFSFFPTAQPFFFFFSFPLFFLLKISLRTTGGSLDSATFPSLLGGSENANSRELSTEILFELMQLKLKYARSQSFFGVLQDVHAPAIVKTVAGLETEGERAEGGGVMNYGYEGVVGGMNGGTGKGSWTTCECDISVQRLADLDEKG